MQLIHRLQLKVVSKLGSSDAGLDVTASFYRPFLDGGYRNMIAQMMDSGCFDGFIQSVIEQLVHSGKTYLFRVLAIFILSGNGVLYSAAGSQSETTDFQPINGEENGEIGQSWSLILQFLGSPTRARLTSMSTKQFLDIYFP